MALRGRQLKAHFAYHQVAEEISKQIFDGHLTPGERLPGELELAELFGVTRSTVREGLRQLESDGLVHRPTPRRLEVTAPQIDKLASRASRSMAMMKVTFRDLYQVALATEPLAAELAAQMRSEDEIAALRDLHQHLCAARDLDEMIELDMRFHSLVAEISQNMVLVLAREPIALLLYSAFHRFAPTAPKATERQIEAHARVIDCIAAGDPDGARLWARRHIEDFWRAIELAGMTDAMPIFQSATR